MQGVLLGTDISSGEPISLTTGDRMLGTYVIGITGTGKSTLILNMIVQDIEAGHGLTLLDPHGDLADDVLARVPEKRKGDVIYLDFGDEAYPPGFDIYCAPKSDSAVVQSRQITSSVNAFKKLLGKESWGPRMENLLRMIAIAFRENPGCTMTEIPPILTHEGFLQLCLDNIETPAARNFWLEYQARKAKDSYIESTMTKVNAFLTDPMLTRIVGQPGKVVDFIQAMAQNKIILAKIPAGLLGDGPTNFIGSMIVDRLITAALERAKLPQGKRPFYAIYCDEFQRFASPDFPTFIAEGRKYGVGLLIAHQWRTQIDEDNRSAGRSARNNLVFQVSSDDAPAFARGFAAPAIPQIEEEETVPPNLWDVLTRKGHPDQWIMSRIQNIQQYRTQIEHELRGIWHQKGFLTSQLKSSALDPLDQYLNNYLYKRLTGIFAGDAETELDGLLRRSQWQVGDYVVIALASDLIYLGDRLREVRLDYAKKDQNRKLGEISYGLSTLPSYHAKCKLMQSGTVVECTIKTNAPPEPQPSTIAQGIIAESRRRYCTPAREVDRKLTQFQAELEEYDADEDVTVDAPEPITPTPATPREPASPYDLPVTRRRRTP